MIRIALQRDLAQGKTRPICGWGVAIWPERRRRRFRSVSRATAMPEGETAMAARILQGTGNK